MPNWRTICRKSVDSQTKSQRASASGVHTCNCPHVRKWDYELNLPTLPRLPERFGNLMLRDKVADGFEQHILLRPPEINPQLLERDNNIIVGIVVTTDMQLRLAAGFDRPNRCRRGLRLSYWFLIGVPFFARRSKQ